MTDSKDTLGDRMKSFYEDAYRIILPKRMPVIIRLDGRAFSSYTRGLKRPVDENLVDCFGETVMYLCKEIQGAKIAYHQSDEISILLVNYNTLNTESWFNNNLQKMVSIASSLASSYFTSISSRIFGHTKLAQFDARVFVMPKEEVNNYFYWRQTDCTRNSLQSLARTMYSQKQLYGKNSQQLHDLCMEKGVNWNDCPTAQKRGRCAIKQPFTITTDDGVSLIRHKWVIDSEIPIFSQDKNYINQYL